MKKLLSLSIVALAVVASVATLPPPPPPEWKEATDFEVRVGVGWDAFDPYDDGEPIPVEQGFQGGQHINVTLLAKDVEPDVDAVVTLWLVRGSDEALLEGPELEIRPFEEPESLGFTGTPEGARVLAGMRLLVDDPDAAIGEEAELRVQVDPGDGRIGRAWFRGTVEWGPSPWDEPEDAGVTDDAGVIDGG